MKQKVILVCTECLSRNYSVTKNKRLNVERLELRKYCKKCRNMAEGNKIELCCYIILFRNNSFYRCYDNI